MLRVLVLTCGCLLGAAGGICVFFGVHVPGIQALVLGLLIVAGVGFERWRYTRLTTVPGGRWQATGERFADPQSGAEVEVYYDPHTGERRYVSPGGGSDAPG